jgi:type IX secretion system PorP/SprF family membrane protein
MSKHFLIFIFSFILSGYSFSQDPHYSQFFASPLTLNPANTGNFDGSYRAIANFRNQWPSFNNAYKTYTISLDAPILEKKIPEYDRLGIGIVAMSDRSGNGLLSENDVAFSVAYKKSLDDQGFSSISAGLQASYINYRFNPSMAYFEDQLTADGFTMPSSELLLGRNLSKSFVDFHAGLIYTLSTTEYNLFYIGSSYFHTFSPAMQFNDQQNNLSPRFNIHGGGYLPLSFNSTIHASFQYQQQQIQNEILLGAVYSYYLQPNTRQYVELYLGSWIRVGDAIIPYVGIDYNQIMLGVSYDINITKKTEAQYFRSGEISLTYKFNRYANGKSIKCPIY